LDEVVAQIQNPKKECHLKRLDSKAKEVRTKVLDWMLIVNYRLTFLDQTYLLTTDLIDILLNKFKISDNEDYMHALSIASLFIANKMEEVQQISAHQAVERISHDKLDKETILEAEQFILKKLKYKLPQNHFCDFAYALIQQLSNQNHLKPKNNESDVKLPNINSYMSSPKSSNNLPTLSKKSSDPKIKSKFHVNSNKTNLREVIESQEPSLQSEIDREYDNIVYLFALSVYKMMRFEYDIYKDTDTMLLYFSIINFSINQVNQMLGFKGKTCFTKLFNTAALYNIKTTSILEFASVVDSIYEKKCDKYKYLKEVELINFLNKM